MRPREDFHAQDRAALLRERQRVHIETRLEAAREARARRVNPLFAAVLGCALVLALAVAFWSR